MEKHNLAWMEDMVPWQLGHLMKQIKDNTTTPILTGEDIFLKEEFVKLIDMEAVDMIHPDLASSGGLIETKKIGDYAMERGVPMAMHFAGTPISFMANVHCAAATENFIALEHHSIDVPWWEQMVTTPKPMIEKGFAIVPGPARSRRRAERGGRQGAPGAERDLLRADAGVGHVPQQRPALELRSRVTRRDRRAQIVDRLQRAVERRDPLHAEPEALDVLVQVHPERARRGRARRRRRPGVAFDEDAVLGQEHHRERVVVAAAGDRVDLDRVAVSRRSTSFVVKVLNRGLRFDAARRSDAIVRGAAQARA